MKIIGPLLVCSLFLCACAAVKLDARDTRIVMAKKVERGQGASEITDSFTFEGLIYAYLTFLWDPGTTGGQQELEVKWYNGDRLISRRTQTVTLDKPPYYVWFQTRGTALGEGQCRVEVYANGIFLGSKSFTVSKN